MATPRRASSTAEWGRGSEVLFISFGRVLRGSPPEGFSNLSVNAVRQTFPPWAAQQVSASCSLDVSRPGPLHRARGPVANLSSFGIESQDALRLAASTAVPTTLLRLV